MWRHFASIHGYQEIIRTSSPLCADLFIRREISLLVSVTGGFNLAYPCP
ncbi:uncharacterized protein ARMOST_20734 [Armillaria ostoyae]|uniref:Uncharacterized protein n=1 Tax=Armillaria ostoyae TaxID=47428 RepID=A0A284S846_ARMOS|nr:uncharacterized protein ARMOST_20734 [Armillaria ostoyae]